MFNHRINSADIGAIFLAVIVTFFLQSALTIPRLMSMTMIFNSYWGSSPVSALSSAPSNVIDVYEFMVFLFALPAGLLAIASTRVMARASNVAIVCLGVSAFMLLYAVLTLVLRGRMPTYFFPTYLDLAAALPGWFIGYFFAGGAAAFEFSKALPAGLALMTLITATAVAIIPSYMPFYETVPGTPTLESSSSPAQENDSIPTFQQVPEPDYRPQPVYQPPPSDVFSKPFRPVTRVQQ